MKTKILPLFLVVFFLFFQASCKGSRPVVIYGDSRTNHPVHRKIVKSILKENPKVVFHVGDLVEDGASHSEWDIFHKITSKLAKKAKIYPALGNHERDSQLFFDNFSLPGNERWYSVDISNMRFIILDSNPGISKESKQYKWLEDNLQSISKKIKFSIAIFHHAPFSVGKHQEDVKHLRKTIVPLFEKYKVDVVFNGHTHAYERALYNNIYYIVTGGAGANLHDKTRNRRYNQAFIKAFNFCVLSLDGDNLKIRALDIDSNVIDEFTITSKH